MAEPLSRTAQPHPQRPAGRPSRTRTGRRSARLQAPERQGSPIRTAAQASLDASTPTAAQQAPDSTETRTLVVGCGALVNELLAVVEHHGLPGVDVECLPAKLHNRPSLIVGELRKRLDRLASEGRRYERLVIGYADCGTAGDIDLLCEELTVGPCEALTGARVVRLPGAHCYEFFATQEQFAALAEAEPCTFYLTDFLARHFDTLVWKGLGIAAHPELADMYFGNYQRLLLLTQTPDPDERVRVRQHAQAAAQRLGLPLEVRETGYGELSDTLVAVAAPRSRAHRPATDGGIADDAARAGASVT